MIFRKYFLLVCIISFILNMAMSMINTPMPMYMQTIGGNNSDAGLIAGLFSLGSLIFRPISGNILDAKGRRIVLLVGVLIFVLVTISFNFTTVIAILFFLRIIHGAGFSIFSTATGTMVADIVPPNRIVYDVGLFGALNTVSTAIGPALGLWLAMSYSYNTLFNVAAVFCVIALCILFFLDYEKKTGSVVDKPIEKVKQKAVLFEKTSLPVALTIFFMFITIGVIITFLPALAISRNIPNVGLYYLANAAALLFTRIVIGKLTSKFGFSKIIIIAFVFLGFSVIALSQMETLLGLIVAGISNGLGFGCALTILNSLLIKMCPVNRRGAANATFYAATDFGIGIGGVVGGFVSQMMGYSFIFLYSAVFVVFAALSYICFVHKKVNEESSAAKSV